MLEAIELCRQKCISLNVCTGITLSPRNWGHRECFYFRSGDYLKASIRWPVWVLDCSWSRMNINGPMTCQTVILNSFLKMRCSDKDGNLFYKCSNSDQFYSINLDFNPRNIVSELCDNDTYSYQTCGIIPNREMAFSDKALCGGYFCSPYNWTQMGLQGTGLQYLEIEDWCGATGDSIFAANTMLCSNVAHKCGTGNQTDAQVLVTLQSGRKCSKKQLCNGVCEVYQCEDEADCNGYQYGTWCTDSEYYSKTRYVPPSDVCNNPAKVVGNFESKCKNQTDERDCEGVKGRDTCRLALRSESYSDNRNSLIPLKNNTRCGAINLKDTHRTKCIDHTDQTNCSDPSVIAGSCFVHGYRSNISVYIECNSSVKDGTFVCDEGEEEKCLSLSPKCYIHKHRQCDDVQDCPNGEDEKVDICEAHTERTCARKFGRWNTQLEIPLSWLMDDEEDCMEGDDEQKDARWPTCGDKESLRFVHSSRECSVVFLCKDGRHIELDDLCSDHSGCVEEGRTCKAGRGSIQHLFTSVKISRIKSSLIKSLHYCSSNIQSLQQLTALCVEENFNPLQRDVFGLQVPVIRLREAKVECDHSYGELYVYLSCLEKCPNSQCPLTEHSSPTYDSCPNQYKNRIGTVVNNTHLTFVTVSGPNTYTNEHFFCGESCISYSKVCDLVFDCVDKSDEMNCTNHFKCESENILIPKSAQCNGRVDCWDFSDECNSSCKDLTMLNADILKLLSWSIGILSVCANIFVLHSNVKNMVTSSNSSSLKLTNNSLVLLVCIGDFLVGGYLLAVSVTDVYYGSSYCSRKFEWLTSPYCSILGVLSTIGSQLSLFAMTVLSLKRANGILNTKSIPVPVNSKSIIQCVGTNLLIFCSTLVIAIIPLLPFAADYFVNGVYNNSKIKIFLGVANKDVHMSVIEGYFGRMLRKKNGNFRWNNIFHLIDSMFTHEPGYTDPTLDRKNLNFYGSSPSCMFKFFVTEHDPQRGYVWFILTLNFVCFFVITICYTLITVTSTRSTSRAGISKGSKKLQNRVTMIIITDFISWVPFIVVCGLHYLSVFDATPWYSIFSLVVMPINSLINPLLYNEEIAILLGKASSRMTTAAVSIREFLFGEVQDVYVVEMAGISCPTAVQSPDLPENDEKTNDAMNETGEQ